MSFIEAADPTVTAVRAPALAPWRPGNVADRRKRRFGTPDAPPFRTGVSSCHYQRRVADDKASAKAVAAEALAALPPPPAIIDEVLPTVDAATSDLRRRVLESADMVLPDGHSRLVASWLVAGISTLLWLGLADLIWKF